MDWKVIYMLPRKTAYNTYWQSFQYKILNIITFSKKNCLILDLKRLPFVRFTIWKMKHFSPVFQFPYWEVFLDKIRQVFFRWLKSS